LEVRELARVAGSLDGKGALHFGPQATCVESRPVWEESQDPASEVPEERVTAMGSRHVVQCFVAESNRILAVPGSRRTRGGQAHRTDRSEHHLAALA